MTQDHNNDSDTYVLFQVAGTTYGVRSGLVQQMEMIDHITPVPNASPVVDGVIFSRGRVVPAISLRARFGFERAPIESRTRLVVVGIDGRTVGFIVDTAREFISIPAQAIAPPSDGICGLSGKYLEGIATLADRIVLILNLTEVINLAEIIEGGAQSVIRTQPERI